MMLLTLGHEELFARAADTFAQSANEAVLDRGVFSVALSGGSTPKRLYSLLADGELPWSMTRVFFSDERCVPWEHSESNYGTAHQELLSKVAIPSDNIHRMRGELDPTRAADDYSAELVEAFKLERGAPPRFDLLLLGLGEDGHTASIFPGSDALADPTGLVKAVFVPKLQSWRLTLTPRVIQNARKIMVIAVGANKAGALRLALEGPDDLSSCPAQLLSQAAGKVIWLADPEAASMLAKV